MVSQFVHFFLLGFLKAAIFSCRFLPAYLVIVECQTSYMIAWNSDERHPPAWIFFSRFFLLNRNEKTIHTYPAWMTMKWSWLSPALLRKGRHQGAHSKVWRASYSHKAAENVSGFPSSSPKVSLSFLNILVNACKLENTTSLSDLGLANSGFLRDLQFQLSLHQHGKTANSILLNFSALKKSTLHANQ